MSDDDTMEGFRMLKEMKREEKRERYVRNLSKLGELGIKTEKLNDYEFKFQVGEKVIKFWPSTGYWTVLGTQLRGWGLDKLLRLVGFKKDA